jgi:hypothetical protein
MKKKNEFFHNILFSINLNFRLVFHIIFIIVAPILFPDILIIKSSKAEINGEKKKNL